MARLFVTPREIDFITDISKELVKDVVGQTVYLYSISEIKTKIHPIYKEAPNKIFEKPIRLDARVEWEPQDIRTNEFGSEEYTSVTALLIPRDMYDDEVAVSEGDFFSFGSQFFEITAVRRTANIYGQIEYSGGIQLVGKEARMGNFVTSLKGPTDETYSDEDAIQDEFFQQRGYTDNQEGPTGDLRDLQAQGILDAPLTGPSQITHVSGSSAKPGFDDDQD